MSHLRFVLIIATIISTISAQGGNLDLILTAKEAVKLYIDGALQEIPNGRNMSLTDTVPVTYKTRIIAVQGIDLVSGCPGVLASVTDDYFLSNSSWKCFDISGGEEWTNIGFDDSHWPNASELRQNSEVIGSQCPDLPYMPTISSNAFWIWMENTNVDIVYCRGYLPVCSSSPCMNGGTCNINEVEQCTCVAGFTGTYCETEVNECVSGPCLNGGTCADLLGAFECSCSAGYTGTRCETDVLECASEPCLNNGTCEDYVNSYQCICPANYTGYDCETKVDECSRLPCKNNGTCFPDSDIGYNCSCPVGVTGSDCETDVAECDSQPCLNNGTCQELVNGFRCICYDKYTGTHCETSEATSSLTLTVTADRSLAALYVDNVFYPVDVSSGINWTLPDHIAIPASSSLIALRASNSFTTDCSGILASIGGDFVTDATWKCSTENVPGWFSPGFNDSHWPQAVEYGPNTAPFLCPYRVQIPEISSSAQWIWTDNLGISINCRVYLDQCASGPCQNGGTCTEVSNGGYNCSCDPRFTGLNCESDLYLELVLTADRSIVVLFVDGIERILNVTTSNTWSLTEAVLIDRSTTLIAIRAHNAVEAACSGILSSIGNYFLSDVSWKCSTENPPGWFSVGFNDSSWPNAVAYDLNSPPFQCSYRNALTPISSSAQWIYTGLQTASANCRGYLP